MIVVENRDSLGNRVLNYSTIAEGCDVDFLDKLQAHLAFNEHRLASYGMVLNGTLAQLAEIEKLIVAHRGAANWHSRAFFQGLVAYCGELLRSCLPGEWGLLKAEPTTDYPRVRYFPVIVDAKNQTYSFSASIEAELAYLLNPDLNWDKMDGLYYAMKFGALTPDLPLGKAAGPLFPF